MTDPIVIWAHANPWLAASLGFWVLLFGCVLGWGLLTLAEVVLRLPVTLISRVLRTVKVLARGWPPSHLDADGDWRPPEPKAEPDLGELVTETRNAIGETIETVRTYRAMRSFEGQLRDVRRDLQKGLS